MAIIDWCICCDKEILNFTLCVAAYMVFDAKGLIRPWSLCSQPFWYVSHSLYFLRQYMLVQLRKHWRRNSARPSLNYGKWNSCTWCDQMIFRWNLFLYNSKVYLLFIVVLFKIVSMGLLTHGMRPMIIPPFEAFCEACSLYLSNASCDSAWIIFISLNHLLYNAILNSVTKNSRGTKSGDQRGCGITFFFKAKNSHTG